MVRFDMARATKAAAVPFTTLVRQVTANQNPVVLRRQHRDAGAPPSQHGRLVPVRIRRAHLHGRSGDRVQAGSKGWSATGRLDERGASGLHQPRVRRLSLPGARAQHHSARRSESGRLTPSPFCRRGIGRGGRISATPPCSAWLSSASTGCSAAAWWQGARRAQFAEARLRAEAAEALAATESEGKKNVELLSEIGPRNHGVARHSTRSSAGSTTA